MTVCHFILNVYPQNYCPFHVISSGGHSPKSRNLFLKYVRSIHYFLPKPFLPKKAHSPAAKHRKNHYIRRKIHVIMFGKNISGPGLKAMVWLSTALYILLALLYFLPVALPYEITYPVAAIAIFSIWLVPLPMSIALIASAAGDLMGAAGNFMAQMECFAVANLFISLFFLHRLFQTGKASVKNFSAILTKKRIAYLTVTGICVAATFLMVMVSIVPEVPAGVQRAGVAFYAIVVALMFYSALLQRSIFYAVGAFLFVLSDFILAWNAFVEPIEYSRYLIMIPYFIAQWMFYVRATKYRVGKSLLLARL